MLKVVRHSHKFRTHTHTHTVALGPNSQVYSPVFMIDFAPKVSVFNWKLHSIHLYPLDVFLCDNSKSLYCWLCVCMQFFISIECWSECPHLNNLNVLLPEGRLHLEH